MRTEVRTKVKPQKSSNAAEDLRTGIRIQVEDLQVGDRIVLSWHRAGTALPVSNETIAYLRSQVVSGTMSLVQAQEQFLEELVALTGSRYVNRSKKVERIELCEGKWRTHIHVNKQDCYDTRQYIWIADMRSGDK